MDQNPTVVFCDDEGPHSAWRDKTRQCIPPVCRAVAGFRIGAPQVSRPKMPALQAAGKWQVG